MAIWKIEISKPRANGPGLHGVICPGDLTDRGRSQHVAIGATKHHDTIFDLDGNYRAPFRAPGFYRNLDPGPMALGFVITALSERPEWNFTCMYHIPGDLLDRGFGVLGHRRGVTWGLMYGRSGRSRFQSPGPTALGWMVLYVRAICKIAVDLNMWR